MISFDTIGLMFQFEAVKEEYKFSKFQSQELYEIGVKMSELKSGKSHIFSSIHKYKKLEKQYIKKFEEYGGDLQKLDKTLKDFEKKSIPLINEFTEKIRKLKESMGLK